MTTLSEIEKLAEGLSGSRQNLKDGLDELESEVSATKKKFMPALRRAIEKAAGWHQKLHNAVSESPELFQKPKTLILHGIRLGYMKSKGEIIWQDTDQVVRLIKKHFPEQIETLIQVKETPMKAALAQLSVADLKKIGVTVTDTGDEVVVRPTDSEIDKLINALLKDEEIEKAA